MRTIKLRPRQYGRVYEGQGYIRVWKPKHPYNNHGYVLEHRLVVERNLGRYLKKNEVVHHLNGVKDDNRLKNLSLMTRHTHPANHLVGKKRPIWIGKQISKSLMGHEVSKENREKNRQAKLKNPVRYWLGKAGDPRLSRNRNTKGRFKTA